MAMSQANPLNPSETQVAEPAVSPPCERAPYAKMHLIAPYDGSSFPRSDSFFPVLLNDLSRRGFSFMSHRAPGYEAIVIGIRVLNEMNYLTARVRASQPHPDDARKLLVDCEFTGRIA